VNKHLTGSRENWTIKKVVNGYGAMSLKWREESSVCHRRTTVNYGTINLNLGWATA
jgi:hypothetical protein